MTLLQRSPTTSSAQHARSRVKAIVASDRFWLGVTALLTLILFAPILNDWFQTDDFLYLRAGRLGSVPDILREAFDFTAYDRQDEGTEFIRNARGVVPFWAAYRPLYFTSLEAMYLVFGDNATGWHTVSIVVHLANTLLVWLIASRLLPGRVAPHVAAAIFALHPAYAGAVAWVADVGTLLATFTGLVALLLFMRGVEADRLRIGWYAGSLVAYTASIFFNQETLAWIAAFAGVFFLLDRRMPERLFNARSWPVLAPFVAVFSATYALQSWIVLNTPILRGQHQIGAHMLTQFKNLASGSLFPVRDGHAEGHFVAFVGFLVILALLLVLPYLVRTTAAPRGTALFAIVWLLSSMVPFMAIDGFFRIGVLNRKLYSVGPSLAILLVLFGSLLLSLVPIRFTFQMRAVVAVLMVAALAGGMALAQEHRQDATKLTVQSEEFVDALEEAYPVLPEGSTLYVVGAPFSMRLFGDLYLVTAAQFLYGKVDAYNVGEEELATIKPLVEDGEFIFRYHPRGSSP